MRITYLLGKSVCVFFTFKRKEYGVSTGHARTTHGQRTYNVRGTQDKWHWDLKNDSRRQCVLRPWTNVDVPGTHVTRNVGESVACTQLERRESSACTKHASFVPACSQKHTKAALTDSYILRTFFARWQHALARTAGCDRGFNEVIPHL